MHEMWIVGSGLGPGKPSKGYPADNGGEFVGKEVIDIANSFSMQSQ